MKLINVDYKKHVRKIPHLSELRSLAKDFGVTPYLVGGFLRDIFFEEANRKFDFDFALSDKAIDFARAFAELTGGTFILLDKEQRSARVAIKGRSRIYDYDFNVLRADTIEDDLRLRDFTVNSLAVSILDRNLKLIDSAGALEDIERKKMRTYHADNLKSDPVRLMRAFSFSARFGLSICDLTQEYIALFADNLRHAPFERISDELFKMLKHDHSFANLKLMDEIGLLNVILPESIEMRGMEQGDFHHLDVWGHSLETVRCYEHMYMRRLKRHPHILDYLHQEIAQGRDRNQLIKFACLIHDIGKPAARAWKGKRTIFYEHDKIGRDMSIDIARRFKLSAKEEEFLKRLVYMHMRPGHLADTKMPSEKAIYRFFRDCEGEGAGVVIVSLSDWRATRGKGIKFDHRKSHERIMIKMIDQHFEKANEKPLKPILNGHELMSLFKIEPSKTLSLATKYMLEAQALGEVKNKTQAKKVMKEWYKNENT